MIQMDSSYLISGRTREVCACPSAARNEVDLGLHDLQVAIPRPLSLLLKCSFSEAEGTALTRGHKVVLARRQVVPLMLGTTECISKTTYHMFIDVYNYRGGRIISSELLKLPNPAKTYVSAFLLHNALFWVRQLTSTCSVPRRIDSVLSPLLRIN